MGGRCEDLADRLWPENLQDVQDNLSRSAGIPMLFAHVSGRPLAACEDLTAFCRAVHTVCRTLAAVSWVRSPQQ